MLDESTADQCSISFVDIENTYVTEMLFWRVVVVPPSEIAVVQFKQTLLATTVLVQAAPILTPPAQFEKVQLVTESLF